MLVSHILIILGIWMIPAGWELVYQSQGSLVTHRIYKYRWHPMYAGIYVIMLILWPFVIWMYYRLARKEEQQALEKFPEQYRRYMQQTPMFFPKLLTFLERNKSD